MRVFVVSCVFPPEPIVSSQTSEQIAQELASQGHDVTVITTFPNRPAGKIYPGYSRRLIYRQYDGAGYRIVRCFSFFSKRSRMLSRFLENISFGLIGGSVAFTLRRPDVIYANTWPVFATGLIYLVSWLRRIPLVISVQDIYPESLISQKRIKADGIFAKWLRYCDRAIVRGCHDVIVISWRFGEYCRQRGAAVERLHIVPNWGNEGEHTVDNVQAERFRARLGLCRDAFLCVYGGNISAASGIETVIYSFAYLRELGELRLLIAGEGSHLSICRDLAKKDDGLRVLFHSPWPREETFTVLSAADVLILPTRGNQSLVSVPSKLIAYLLSARPVIALAHADSDLADLISKSECGWVVEPDQPERLAGMIKGVMNLGPVGRKHHGQIGRVFALQNMTRMNNLPRVINIIEKAAQA